MKRLIWTIALIFTLSAMRAEDAFRTRALAGNIRSVQAANYGRSPYLPVIELGSTDRLTLTFDDLASNTSTYSFRFVHCNADWTPDDLMESDYMEGFASGYLEDYAFSENTYFSYTHYEKSFPDEYTGFRISGNYALLVFAEERPDDPVLSACFSVVEQQVEITPSVTALTDMGYQKDYQQVALELDYTGADVAQSGELNVTVRQNGRLDNAARQVRPDYATGRRLSYKHDRQLIFEAGNTFRVFDISARYVLGDRVESVDYHAPYYHVTLYPDETRASKPYSYTRDVAGRYQVHCQGADNPGVESDYFFTHFSLPMEPLLDESVYLMGELTGYRLDEGARMDYNPSVRAYEKTLLLKQGGYNYQYVTAPDGSPTGSTRRVEGNRWEAGNEYTAYVYHRPFGGRYDRLIGFTLFYADKRYEKP